MRSDTSCGVQLVKQGMGMGTAGPHVMGVRGTGDFELWCSKRLACPSLRKCLWKQLESIFIQLVAWKKCSSKLSVLLFCSFSKGSQPFSHHVSMKHFGHLLLLLLLFALLAPGCRAPRPQMLCTSVLLHISHPRTSIPASIQIKAAHVNRAGNNT